MRTQTFLVLAALAFAPAEAAEPSARPTKVPRWDARGVGPLPWQGVACLDVDFDGNIAIGTIAPPGDPNVFRLDGNGKVLRQQHVGQRWIESVAIDDDTIRALCTMPAGKSG